MRRSACPPLAATAVTLALALAGCSGSDEPARPSPRGGVPTWEADASAAPSAAPSSATASADVPGPVTTSSGAPTGADAVPRPARSTVPPLGPDLACMNPDRCYLQNPAKRSDAELVRYFRTLEGADRPPAPAMRPWAYVVLGAGTQRLVARAAPSEDAAAVTDEIGVLNHRAVFAFCRQAAGGGPVAPGADPARTWFRIEPLTPDAPPQVWMNGRYLVAYGHDGAIPTC